MERYAHVTAAQQRDAADLLDRLCSPPLTVTMTVTEPADGVVESRPESARSRAIRAGKWLRR